MVPIERMTDFKQYFVSRVTGLVRDLSEDEFVAVFRPLMEKQMFSEDQLRQWFRDIDVDASEAVSWDEFTSFMIYQASSFGEDNHRAREMVANVLPGASAHTLHKDLVRRIATHRDCDRYVTAGYDGLIKAWTPADLACVRTVNNSELSAARETEVKGQASVCPVADLVFNTKGSHVFACATDKTVTAYDAASFGVHRRFLGRWKINEQRNVPRGGLVECTTLMDMQDTPNTIDVVAPKGKEVLYLGMQDGAIMAYPTTRNALIPQLTPHFSSPAHTDAVTKLRFLPGFDMIMCSSWDKTLSLCSPETGRVVTRLDGGIGANNNKVLAEAVKHNKMAFDFAWNPMMRVVATVACEREVFLWNPSAPSPVAILKGHATLLQSVAFDPIDRQMFSLDQENTIKVWDLRMLRVSQTLNESSIHTQSSFMRMATITYDDRTSTLVGASHRLSSWTVRRAFSHFPPRHSGHTESLVSFEYVRTTDTAITVDQNIVMAWDTKTGRRNIVFDPHPGEYGRIAALGIDRNERRIFVASKDGTVKVMNFRNGQLLREVTGKTASEPIRVVHCSSRDASSKCFCVVSPDEALVYNEVPPASGLLSPEPDRVLRPRTPGTTFTCAIEMPSDARSTAGHLVLGTNRGGLLVYSAVTGHAHAALAHPLRPQTRRQRERRAAAGEIEPVTFLTARGAQGVSRQERVDAAERRRRIALLQRQQQLQDGTASPDDGGGQPAVAEQDTGPTPEGAAADAAMGALFRLPVEDLVHLPGKDLFVSCLGDNTLHFWDLRRNQLRLSYCTRVEPPECLLCLASPPARDAATGGGVQAARSDGTVGETLLIAADDRGFVYVRDISRLETSRDAALSEAHIVLLHVFRAHAAPITRLACAAPRHEAARIITLAADMFVKQWTLGGVLVGYFGQKDQWQAGKPSTT